MTKALLLITLLSSNFCFSNTTSIGNMNTEKAYEDYCMSFDTNGDGVLNQAERVAYKKSRRLDLIRRFDSDNDGKLNRQEKVTAKETLKRQLESNSNNYSLAYYAQ